MEDLVQKRTTERRHALQSSRFVDNSIGIAAGRAVSIMPRVFRSHAGAVIPADGLASPIGRLILKRYAFRTTVGNSVIVWRNRSFRKPCTNGRHQLQSNCAFHPAI
jgi:hypothetical protein